MYTVRKIVDGLYVDYNYTDQTCNVLVNYSTYKDDMYNILHNENGPAYETRYQNGVIQQQYYFVNGEEHRDNDLPACIFYNDKGNVTHEYWYKHGKQHRDNGPAVVHYEDGVMAYTVWHKDGCVHNITGPATCINMNTNKIREYYYVEGRQLTKIRFLRKYMPHEYQDYLKNKVYYINGKKYKISHVHTNGRTITMELV